MSNFASVTPTGSVNGTNTVFTVTLGTGILNSVEFYVGGLLLSSGVDYSISGIGSATSTITTSTPPASGLVVNSWLFQQ